jgi:hypothetical protein
MTPTPTPMIVDGDKSLGCCDYLEEFLKLDFNDRQELGNDLLVNQYGYFMFDVRNLDNYALSLPMAESLRKATKFYLFGKYSIVHSGLEVLIDNGLHLQIEMLDIEINDWDSMYISWELLVRFEKLKLLYIDGCNAGRFTKSIPDITAWIPHSLEALSIINMPYYNAAFNWYGGLGGHNSHGGNVDGDVFSSSSTLKVLKMMALKWNQELGSLPDSLECLILESGDFNKELGNLPNSLKALVMLCPKFSKRLDMLPHGLEYFAGLHFNCFTYPECGYEKDLGILPSSLKSVLLDKTLYEKQGECIKRAITGCQVGYYQDVNNFEFILKHLIERI